ncbi:hypothetical protein [Rhodoferax saidenbachensis]|uniref:hypothetical protein n=1 Tax=Rhodoferax saidenbachensis TaxID=1484693 RepID=UPI00055CB363|nr:hypothetical protein [Rhodoferax saidenbachensis]
MNWNQIECPTCAVRLQTRVRGMGVPGGKERENGFCPICGTLVISEVTDGFVEVELVSSGGFKITNALTGLAHLETPGGISLEHATFTGMDAVDKFTALYWPDAVMHVHVPIKV